MRILSATLKAAQQSASYVPLVKLVLTNNGTTYTYYKDRIKKITHTEEQLRGSTSITLDNSDGEFTSKDVRGFKGVLSYGIVADGDEYSATAPVYVVSQDLYSAPGVLTCVLRCVSIMDLLGHERASAHYQPDTSMTDTVKTLIRKVMGDSGVTMMPAFNHCTAYNVNFNYEDSLIDVYTPKNGFRVYRGHSRLAVLRRLLSWTDCQMRWGDDGELLIRSRPTEISSPAEGYSYRLSSAVPYSVHDFFSAAFTNGLVVPNYVKVQSLDDETPFYEGTATDATSFAILPIHEYHALGGMTGDAQAEEIAEAILLRYQLQAKGGYEGGYAKVPMNVGQEILDWVVVIDDRSGKNTQGNASSLTRHWDVNDLRTWWMDLSIGGEFNTRDFSNQLQAYEDWDFPRLRVQNLVAENIDLVAMSGDLDDIDNGATYHRVLATHIDAGKIKLTSATTVSGFDLDMVEDGTTYKLVLATQITANEIVLQSSSFLVNQEKIVAGTEGTNSIELKSTGIKGYNSTVLQFHLDATDGKIKAGGGDVILDADGIRINDEDTLKFYDGDGTYCGKMQGSADELWVVSAPGRGLRIYADNNSLNIYTTTSGDIRLSPAGNVVSFADVLPSGTVELGVTGNRWDKGWIDRVYAQTRLVIPVGTDMYD